MKGDAPEAAVRITEALKDRIRTHHAPAPIERRGKHMTEAERRARQRNGRRTGPFARLRRKWA